MLGPNNLQTLEFLFITIIELGRQFTSQSLTLLLVTKQRPKRHCILKFWSIITSQPHKHCKA